MPASRKTPSLAQLIRRSPVLDASSRRQWLAVLPHLTDDDRERLRELLVGSGEDNLTPQPPEVNLTPQPPEVNLTPQPPEVNLTPQPAEDNLTPQPPLRRGEGEQAEPR